MNRYVRIWKWLSRILSRPEPRRRPLTPSIEAHHD